MLRPADLLPAQRAPAETGFARVLWKKWYGDEIYDTLIVRPIMWVSREVLWKILDVRLVDGAGVNGAAAVSPALGWVGSPPPTGAPGFAGAVFSAGLAPGLPASV